MFYVGDFNLFLKEIVKHVKYTCYGTEALTIYELYTCTCKICSSSLKLFWQRQRNETHGRAVRNIWIIILKKIHPP